MPDRVKAYREPPLVQSPLKSLICKIDALFVFLTSFLRCFSNLNIKHQGPHFVFSEKNLALESRDLSQTDTILIVVSSFPKLIHLRNDCLLN